MGAAFAGEDRHLEASREKSVQDGGTKIASTLCASSTMLTFPRLLSVFVSKH